MHLKLIQQFNSIEMEIIIRKIQKEDDPVILTIIKSVLY